MDGVHPQERRYKMATKAQERAALEKIAKIVDALGEESYIGKAFEGCFDVAADNIDNDFWNSPMASAQELRKKLDSARAQLDIAVGKENEAEKKLESANKMLQIERTNANDWYDKYNEAKAMAEAAKREADNGTAELQRKVEAQELEIIKLKAKLYDIMVQGA